MEGEICVTTQKYQETVSRCGLFFPLVSQSALSKEKSVPSLSKVITKPSRPLTHMQIYLTHHLSPKEICPCCISLMLYRVLTHVLAVRGVEDKGNKTKKDKRTKEKQIERDNKQSVV